MPDHATDHAARGPIASDRPDKDGQRGGRSTQRRPRAAGRHGRREGQPLHRMMRVLLVAGLLALTAAGFLGLDRWTYAASLTYTNTPDVLDRDFYHVTKPFWIACRILGHPIGAGLAYFLVLGLHRDGWRVANRGLLAVLSATFSSWLLKMLVGRVRPNHADSPLEFLPLGAGFRPDAAISFPSGEATTAFALAAVLTCIYPRWGWALFAAASLTGLARLVQGSHYVSDVAAGALVGAVLAAYVFERLSRPERRYWSAAGETNVPRL
jgi:membrane-associated phospholipid phosphatase